MISYVTINNNNNKNNNKQKIAIDTHLERDFVALGQRPFADKLDDFGEILLFLEDFFAFRSENGTK